SGFPRTERSKPTARRIGSGSFPAAVMHSSKPVIAATEIIALINTAPRSLIVFLSSTMPQLSILSRRNGVTKILCGDCPNEMGLNSVESVGRMASSHREGEVMALQSLPSHFSVLLVGT